jgi:Ca2+-binding RTX toxin-like protein
VDVSAGDVFTVADINGGNLVYTPAEDAQGGDLLPFTFSVNVDTVLAVTPSAADIDVTNANDAPTASDTSIEMDEDTSRVLTVADFNFSDIDPGAGLASVRIDTVTVSNGSFQRSGVDVSAGDIITVADINAGNLVFSPDADEHGQDLLSITFSVNDGTAFAATPSALDIDVRNVAEVAPDDEPTSAQGSNGDDTLVGGNDNDTLRGGDGNDFVSGGAGNDVIWAGRGDRGNDTLDGGAGADTIGGGAGDDFIEGNDGSDHLFGGRGNDTIYATARDDQNADHSANVACGGLGDDLLFGGWGSDTLYGGTGNDTLQGGAGDDQLWAGAGDDMVTGGTGADSFVFGTSFGNDTITDFSVTDDTLNLASTGTEFSSIADIQAAASNTTSGGADGVLLTLGDGNTIFLIGLDVTDLASMDIVL